MSWVPNEKEIQAILQLDSVNRYQHFVRRVVDEGRIWSLWGEGWALCTDDFKRELIPVWPHDKYAHLCAVGLWDGYLPKAIDMDAWLERWIPGIQRDGRLIAVFPIPNDRGIVVESAKLWADLEHEITQY